MQQAVSPVRATSKVYLKSDIAACTQCAWLEFFLGVWCRGHAKGFQHLKDGGIHFCDDSMKQIYNDPAVSCDLRSVHKSQELSSAHINFITVTL